MGHGAPMTDVLDLPDGYYDLPKGKIVAVVTYLDMTEKPPARPVPDQPDLTLVRHEAPQADWYRNLFRTVGEDWLWFSRLHLSDADLSAMITDPKVEVYSVRKGDQDLGLLELNFRDPNVAELGYFGIHSSLIGNGTGRWLMSQAIDIAFAKPIERFFLHTCTLDSPQALAFYERSGFLPYKRAIEVLTDPRTNGMLPNTAAPHIPLL